MRPNSFNLIYKALNLGAFYFNKDKGKCMFVFNKLLQLIVYNSSIFVNNLKKVRYKW